LAVKVFMSKIHLHPSAYNLIVTKYNQEQTTHYELEF